MAGGEGKSVDAERGREIARKRQTIQFGVCGFPFHPQAAGVEGRREDAASSPAPQPPPTLQEAERAPLAP